VAINDSVKIGGKPAYGESRVESTDVVYDEAAFLSVAS